MPGHGGGTLGQKFEKGQKVSFENGQDYNSCIIKILQSIICVDKQRSEVIYLYGKVGIVVVFFHGVPGSTG